MFKTDILIIGAGVVGTAIAREFSKYDLRVLVVDKNEDIGGDASKACSSIAGTGYANPTGSLVCRLSHQSHAVLDQLINTLDIPANRCGCIMPAFNDEEMAVLQKRLAVAHANGDKDVVFLTPEQALEMEPILAPGVQGAIYSPREIAIDTFMMVVALAENAVANGVEFLTSCEVTGIDTADGRIQVVHTTLGDIQTKYIVNCAGLYCDRIAAMVEDIDFAVHPRKGQFFILDKNTPCRPTHIIMPVPTPHTRGKLVLPTAHGNTLVGPTAEDLTDKTDASTTSQGLAEVETDIRRLIPGIVLSDAITEFSGLRPVRTPDGYFLGFSKNIQGIYNVTGVRSDGVTTSLGIAQYVVDEFAAAGVSLAPRTNFISTRNGITRFATCTVEEKEALLKKNPQYGNIICRCETVTEAEIVEAIHRVPGAHSLDAVKRRVRAGMGRCQGGFCTPKLMEILAREMKMPVEEITKRGGASHLLMEKNR